MGSYDSQITGAAQTKLTIPLPDIKGSGPNNSLAWADVAPIFGAEQVQKKMNGPGNYNNRLVHWFGKLISVDNNVAKIQMNPTYEVLVQLPQQLNPPMFSSLLGKFIDFTGNIQKIGRDQATLLFANFNIYSRPAVPPQIIAALKQIPTLGGAEELSNQLGATEATFQQYVTDTCMDMLPTQFKSVVNKAATIACEFQQQLKPNEFAVRTNPGCYKLIIVLAPQVQLPPAGAKPGQLLTITGEFREMTPRFEIIFTGKAVQHATQPGASLSKIPTKGGPISWNPADIEIIKGLKRIGEATKNSLRELRGAARSQSSSTAPSTSSVMPTGSVGPTVIKPPAVVKVAPKAANAVVEPEVEEPKKEEAPKTDEKPVEDAKPEDTEKPTEQPKEGEVDENGVKVDSVIGEDGKYRMEEAQVEDRLKNLGVEDVASLLMREAPKTSYAKTAIEEEIMYGQQDDALKRLQQLKQTGLFENFTNNADKHLDELAAFGGASDQPQQDYYGGGTDYYGAGAGTTDYYGGGADTDNYGGYDYGSGNTGGGYDYNSGSYGGYDYNAGGGY